MTANDSRVPGHYQAGYVHWDLCIDVGMGYLEGCTTKYVARWRRKNGLVDLEKARHYVDKLLETAHRVPQPRRLPAAPAAIRARVHTFAAANGLGDLEERIIADVACWQYASNLTGVPALLDELMTPDPAPLTEENHHADRAPTSRKKFGPGEGGEGRQAPKG